MSRLVPSLRHFQWPPPPADEISPVGLQTKALAGIDGSYRVNGFPGKESGKLMLRAEISTIGDSQEVSSIYSVGSSAPRDRLLDSKCKCGAKEQLIACKGRLERLTRKDVTRRRCAVNRGKLAAAGQAALRMLSDELSMTIIEAEENCKKWIAAVKEESRVFSDLGALKASLASRSESLIQHRTELESLRDREAAAQDELRDKTQDFISNLRKARSELRVERENEDKLIVSLSSAKRELNARKEKIQNDRRALEAARTDLDVYTSVIEEVPSIIIDLDMAEKDTLRETAEYSERSARLIEEMKGIDCRIEGLRKCKVMDVSARKECLQRENKELDRLSEHLNAMQRYVAEHEHRRVSSDTARSDLKEEDEELIEMEKEIRKNTNLMKVNERELESMMGRSDALRKKLRRIEERKKVFQMESKRKRESIRTLTRYCLLEMSAIFDDMFDVKNIDDEKFDRVSRIKAQSHTYNADVEVDINTEIYPIGKNDTLRIAIASAADATEGYQGESAQPGIIDDYEYAMYGKVYKKMNKTVGNETVASRTIM
ncbi:DNA-directed RNA polymerases I, II, and III subunit RPABC3 [Perkinsus chesapeaki]|uniref:DNA-directed RNA polymerases I, II, and III subunit RPABC3 n=1 Tax=Perkinsus chesapeaki TaxID=330153 RepID=A0A7J6MA76_PERCH|nr:DNA-directed RNA polymerases I, II, and III subunit RPABC3 [Perkinsus chesapeaki]